MENNLTQEISIGPTDIQVSPLGIGTNLWNTGQDKLPGLKDAFNTAMELGINLFDTAEVYNLGKSERALGEIMQTSGKRPVITTKFFPYPWRLRRSDLIAALKASLKRLQLSQVDLYLIHIPVPPLSVETWAEALVEAVESGLTRSVGVSNFNPLQMAQAHTVLSRHGIPLAANQVQYSLFKRGPERNGLLDLCKMLNVTLVAYLPLSGGLLTGRFTPENPPGGIRGRRYSRSYIADIQPLLKLIDKIGQEHGDKTSPQVALNWLICKGALPIPGATKANHIRDNAGALGWRLSDEEVDLLDEATKQFTY